jgi:hypothetical protein
MPKPMHAAQKAVHTLPHHSASTLTRKQWRLNHNTSVTVGAVAANMKSASQPMVGPNVVAEPGPLELPLQCQPTLPSATFGGAAFTKSHLPFCVLASSPHLMDAVRSDPVPIISEPVPLGLALSLVRLEAESHAIRL